MIKALIFDFYGVIRSDEYHGWLSRHSLESKGFKEIIGDLDKGLSTLDQFFNSLSKLSNMPPQKIREEFITEGSLNEQLLALILKLKKKYKIALLSNASSPHLRSVISTAGISKLFDEIVISSEIGHIKPSKEIFNYALDKIGIKPDEAVFIDDNINFVKQARKLGIKSINFTGVDSLISNLKEIGIIIK